LAHRLRGELDPMIGAARNPGTGVQKPQVVVDLGDRAHGRARVVRARLLLDGNRRRKPLDAVHVGLVHGGEELPRVDRERLDVAALTLGVERVESERGLTRAGKTGDHDQPLARQVEAEVLEIVGARTAHANVLHRTVNGTRSGHFEGSGATLPLGCYRSRRSWLPLT